MDAKSVKRCDFVYFHKWTPVELEPLTVGLGVKFSGRSGGRPRHWPSGSDRRTPGLGARCQPDDVPLANLGPPDRGPSRRPPGRELAPGRRPPARVRLPGLGPPGADSGPATGSLPVSTAARLPPAGRAASHQQSPAGPGVHIYDQS